MFAAIPLLLLPVLAYNLIALTLQGGLQAVDAHVRMDQQLFSVRMTSHIDWVVSLGDLLLAASLVVLFVELLKSTTSRRIAIVNHALSMVLFIICLVEFLLHPAFATSVFFVILVMALLDVLAGVVVTIISARRDVEFAGQH